MGRPAWRSVVGAGLGLLALATVGMGPTEPPPPLDHGAEPGNRARVCFSSAQGIVCVLRDGLAADVSGPVEPEPLMEALLAGPSAGERARGLHSAIPSGTELTDVTVRGESVTVRLKIPAEAVAELDRQQVEGMVRQVATTLEPVGWRHLHVEALDHQSGDYRPLSDLLPPLPAPRKDTIAGEAGPPGPGEDALGLMGQPPAPGQGQPEGALSGKTVYVSAGHGWQWSSGGWRTQRPPYPTAPYVGPIIEDHNNAEVVNQYLLHYLWNAGAMVWPARERDMTADANIVNNDVPGSGNSYQESGVWTTSAYPGYDLDVSGQTYRYAETVAGPPSAVVTYSASLAEDGRYAVYVWYRHGGDRPQDARYTVHHAGGGTTVLVDQTRHGLTWRYVGTFGFRAAEGAVITLDNASSVPGRAVIADAVRVGGGTFDDLSTIETSATFAPDKPWWEVAAFYYTQRQGLDPGDWPDFNDVIARPMYARWEHRGTGDDALFVSWHTNGASSGYQTEKAGTVSYIQDVQPTPGSAALQAAIHDELVHDIRAGWDASWDDRGKKSADLGEVRELWDEDAAARMPGVLLEIGFHDHPGDTDAIKDPRFELIAARAVYQGIVRYFEQRDEVDLTMLPEPPIHLTVLNAGAGQVTVGWEPSPVDGAGLGGDPASGYRVYVSPDGLGWSDGIPVTTTQHTLTGLAPDQLIYIRVGATNAGGESFPTETLGARVGDSAGVLIVNGFDRLNRFALVEEVDPVEGLNLRIFLDRMNRYDYVVSHGDAIDHAFDSAANEAVAEGSLSLAGYEVVDWVLGEEATMDVSLDDAERAALAAYLDGGGALFISGSELAWDLDDKGRDPSFYRTYLRAGFAGDDAGTYQVAPVAGAIFDGLGSFGFDGPGEYDADYPDRLTPLNGGVAALSYEGGEGGTAAVQFADGCERVVNFGFPFETIRAEARRAVMGRVMDFLGECLDEPPDTHIHSPVKGGVYSAVPPLDGTAFAVGGVDRVEISLRREEDSAYWDGALWGSDPWHVALGTVQWSFTMPLTLDAGAYTARARAWSSDAISDTTPAEAVFTVVRSAAFLPVVLRHFGEPQVSCPDVIVDGGFETGQGWTIVGTSYLAGYTEDVAHSGARSVRIGIPPGETGGISVTYSSISQTVSILAGSAATLHYWTYPICEDPAGGGAQYVWLVDAAGETQVLTPRPFPCEDLRAWDERHIDLSSFAGQTIRLHFSVKNGRGISVTTTYLDDVRLEVCPP